MRRILRNVAVTVFAIALVGGCNKGKDEKKEGASGEKTAEGGAAAPAAPAGDMNMDEACTKIQGVMESMVTAIDTNKTNCDAMAAALDKVVADNKPFLEWAKKQEGDPAKEKEFKEKCEPKMKPTMEKMMASAMGAGECMQNPKVQAAMKSMGD